MRLTQEGFLVWSDVTKLIGGEAFWKDIEEALRKRTIKFIFVLTKESNDPSRRSINELVLADKIGRAEQITDYIIPIRVDELPFIEMHVLLQQLNVIDFKGLGWPIGLSKLIAKLRLDSIPRPLLEQANSVMTGWWKMYVERSDLVRDEPEVIASNWFPIIKTPEFVFSHHLPLTELLSIEEIANLPYPAYIESNKIISFASAEQLGINSTKTEALSFSECSISTKIITILFKRGWLNFLNTKPVSFQNISNKRYCAYFVKSKLEVKRFQYKANESLRCSRNLIGKYHIKNKAGEVKDRYWHFGLSVDVQLDPIQALIFKGHVFFSDDGEKLWESNKRMHATRRSFCRDWWNDVWRDRMLVFLGRLLDSNFEGIKIPMSSTSDLIISNSPLMFDSPVTLNDSELRAPRIEDFEIKSEEIENPIDIEEDDQ